MKLFSIYNKQTNLYNPPFVANTDADAITLCRNAIITGRDPSLVVELENLSLYDLGNFEVDEGRLIPYEKRNKICELDSIPLPERIAKVIEEVRNGKYAVNEEK